MSTETSFVADVEDVIEFAKEGIVSKTLLDLPYIKLVLFCMAPGQSLSEHTSSRPATLLILKGRGEVQFGDQQYTVAKNSLIYIPAQLQHSVKAIDDFVFLLTLVSQKTE